MICCSQGEARAEAGAGTDAGAEAGADAGAGGVEKAKQPKVVFDGFLQLFSDSAASFFDGFLQLFSFFDGCLLQIQAQFPLQLQL